MKQELDAATGVEITDSTGNVFRDLGLPHGEEDMLKVQLARAFTNAVRRRELTQVEVAGLVGSNQGEVSKILSGRLRGLSVERLINMLVALGRDIDINIAAPRKNRSGRIRVRDAAA